MLAKLQILSDFVWGILAIAASVYFFVDGEIGQGIITLIAGVVLAYFFGYRKWKKRQSTDKIDKSEEEGKTRRKLPKISIKKPQFLAKKFFKSEKESEPDKVKSKDRKDGKKRKLGLFSKIFAVFKSKKVRHALVGLVLVAVVIFSSSFLWKSAEKPIKTIDDYPILLLRGGEISVYRELNIYKDHLEKLVVVSNLGEKTQENLKIYEAIPKDVAYAAGNLSFNQKPTIVENDPVVRWDIRKIYASDDPFTLSWKVGGTVGDKKVLGEISDAAFSEAFDLHWPSLTLKNPARTWKEFYEFSKREMEKNGKSASTGKAIMISKDIVDVVSILATGTGALDALNLMSELHSIGTTIYDAETPTAIEDANQWLLIIGLAENGYENKELLKTTMQQGVNVLKTAKGTQAAKTTQKLAQTADAVDDVSPGVSAAESAGLNIVGLIVDYAVINDVARTSKYCLFEMNEQAKMAYLARRIYELWEKYESNGLSQGEMKTLMELETLFFMVQQNELKVREEYFASQTGILDSVWSTIPIVGATSAKQGLKETGKLKEGGQNQISWRRNAMQKVYAGAKAISNQEELKRLETQALEDAKTHHAKDERVSDIIPAGTSKYKEIQRQSKSVIREMISSRNRKEEKGETSYYLTVQATSTPTPRLTLMPTPTWKPTPTPKSTPTSSETSTSGCQKIDLTRNYGVYRFDKSVTPCSSYDENHTSDSYSLRCNNASAQWRMHYVNEVNAGGASKLRFKANIQLIDHANFFGTGVKSDDYAQLTILSSDPNSELASECNRSVSESDWPECSVTKSHSKALGYCGVRAYSESATCDFTVYTSGLSKVYPVFMMSDAWPTEQEGIISNLEVCYE